MIAPSTMAPSAIQYTQPPVSLDGDSVGLMLTWASATCGSAMTASIAAPSGSSIRSTRGWRERIAAILPEGVLPRAWGHAVRNAARSWENRGVTDSSTITLPVETDQPSADGVVQTERLWLVIVWNDPINL